ncbi:DUF211 domain-containing protein [Hyperthermus butylicus]|uniref:DUF211 domain-containing protein n=1 Tax=Hyperthermus butylicus TaxID=54248 RepID=UPI00064FCE39
MQLRGGRVSRELSGLRRLVLDVLKPLKDPSIVDVALELAKVPGVQGVNITVNEVDVETLSLTVVIEGDNIEFDGIRRVLEEVGAAIHSIDQVVAGEKFVEIPRRPQE